MFTAQLDQRKLALTSLDQNVDLNWSLQTSRFTDICLFGLNLCSCRECVVPQMATTVCSFTFMSRLISRIRNPDGLLSLRYHPRGCLWMMALITGAIIYNCMRRSAPTEQYKTTLFRHVFVRVCRSWCRLDLYLLFLKSAACHSEPVDGGEKMAHLGFCRYPTRFVRE